MKQLFPFSLLLAGAACAPALAQDITNNGATITLSGGVTMSVGGSFNNNSGTLDLSSGSNNLYVGGNLKNASGGVAFLTPGSASTVYLNGAAAQQLDLNGAGLANLTVNNTSGGVSLPGGSSTDVAGTLTLTSGMVTTATSSRLRLLDNATIGAETTASYVKGNLAAVKANVPGNAATAFPNSLTVTPTATLTNLTVTRTAGLGLTQVSIGTSASGNQGIDRLWATSAPVNGPVTMTWLSTEDNGLAGTLANAQAWARTAAPTAGSDWTRITPGSVNGTSRTITGTNPANGSFSYFTVSTTASPLPVTLVAFEAQRTGDAALLTWRTASELDNDHFEVEVSADGVAFKKVGVNVAGHGTKSTATDYTFTDPRLLAYAASPVYYRLRQVDGSGKDSYSPVRSIRVEGAVGFALAAFPNPHGSAGTSLQVRTGLTGSLTLAAYDATGRLVFTRSAEVQPGTSALELPEAGQLATGVYYVKATQAGQSTVLKLTRE